MVRFAALLRRHGLPVTPEHVIDGVRALEHLDVGDREEVRTGLRAIFAGRPEDFPSFDRAFDAFWRAPMEADRVAEALAPPALPEHAPAGLERAGRETLALDAWQEGPEGDTGDEPVSVPAASELEAIATRDFSTFSPDQLDEVYRITLKIARRLARRISRRRRPSTRRGRIDLRRTLRANLTRGELIDLRYRRRKRKKVRLVLLFDVSGSIDLYSRFLVPVRRSLPVVVPVCAAVGVLAPRDVHVFGAPPARHRIPPRTLVPRGAAAPHSGEGLVRRHEDRRVTRRVQSRMGVARRPPHDRHAA